MSDGMEQELRREIRLSKINRAILASLKVAGVLTVAAMAPNVSGMLAKYLTRSERGNMKSALRRLCEKGFVTIKLGKVSLTPKGERYLDMRLARPKMLPKTRWDGKWRVIIFDIPERRRALRHFLRDSLIRIGFVRLQNSVWAYPYDCEELITLLKSDYRIGKEVLYMIVDKLEEDGNLRKKFGLAPY